MEKQFFNIIKHLFINVWGGIITPSNYVLVRENSNYLVYDENGKYIGILPIYDVVSCQVHCVDEAVKALYDYDKLEELIENLK